MLEWITETVGVGLDPLGLQTRALLVLWGQLSGSSPFSGYGPPQDVSPDWTTRDGIMLHAFSVWWNASHASKVAEGAGNIAVVAPDQQHLVALTQWATEAGAQVPALQVVDMGASRALLGLWGKTDGAALSGVLLDYGMQPADLSLVWTARDTQMLAAFQSWWNSLGKGTLPTDGTLDGQSSAALKVWFAEAVGKVPTGWVAPSSTPPSQQPPPVATCKPNEVWDEVNKACQPLPTGVTVPEPPAASGGSSKALWLLAGGVVLAGGLLWWLGRQGGLVGAGDVQANPTDELTPEEIREIDRLYRKYVGKGNIEIERLSNAVRAETLAAEKGQIQVSEGLLRELRNDRATIGRIKKKWTDLRDNPAPVEITRRAISKLGDKLGFEWLVFRGSPNWLAYGRQNPSTVSLTVRPGANEGYIVTLRVTPERKSLTPYDRSRFREQAVPSIVVIEGKSLGTRAEAWEQAAHLASALISKHRRWYNENPSGYYVHVRGGNKETYGPYPTLQRAKTFARIGAQNGKHDRVVLRGGKVVRHYRAGTGESLVH